MKSADFLARLRTRTSREPVPLPPLPSREPPSLERFAAELESVKGHFTTVAEDSLSAAILEVARQYRADSFVMAGTAGLASQDIASKLVASGIEQVRYPSDSTLARKALARVSMGIVEADVGISESGTIGIVGSPVNGRLISALPPVLVVMLDPRRLVSRLEDMEDWVKARGPLPSSLSFITGPSATGDLGQKLIFGAHGPAHVHVLAFSAPSLAPAA